MDFQRFAVVPLALADVAGNVNIGQKVHLDLQNAAAFAGFAAAALDIEAEPPRPVAAGLGVLGVRKQGADIAEHAGVGGRVRARGAADRALVDADDLIHPLHAFNLVAGAGAAARAVHRGGKGLIQNFIDQRRFA